MRHRHDSCTQASLSRTLQYSTPAYDTDWYRCQYAGSKTSDPALCADSRPYAPSLRRLQPRGPDFGLWGGKGVCFPLHGVLATLPGTVLLANYTFGFSSRRLRSACPVKRAVSTHALKRHMTLDDLITTIIAEVHIHRVVGSPCMLEVGGHNAYPPRSR